MMGLLAVCVVDYLDDADDEAEAAVERGIGETPLERVRGWLEIGLEVLE